jgi:protein-S-isoprenylcysteine O-methyltransferase Ste14
VAGPQTAHRAGEHCHEPANREFRLARDAHRVARVGHHLYVFLACFLYAIAFVGDFAIAPKTIDSGEPGPLGLALAVNLGLLSLFALQHSGMARPGFKRSGRIVPEPLSPTRAARAGVACSPSGSRSAGRSVPSRPGQPAERLYGGWVMLLYATALIDHFDLFGLRQAWLGFRGQPYTTHPFATPSMYAHVRHPLYVSWAIIFWSTPVMSVGHLLSRSWRQRTWSGRPVRGTRPGGHFGDAYRRYQESTPRYLPRLGGKREWRLKTRRETA